MISPQLGFQSAVQERAVRASAINGFRRGRQRYCRVTAMDMSPKKKVSGNLQRRPSSASLFRSLHYNNRNIVFYLL
jgi:hypothetical protein